MTAIHQEVLPKPEQETQEVDGIKQESTCETTKELFRRDRSPDMVEPPVILTSKIPNVSPTCEPPNKPLVKSTLTKKESATKKKSNSGIPLRLKSGGNVVKNKTGTGTYRHSSGSPMGPVINKNTLEVQFINNKKRLLQLHSELVDKQRPLLDMHKSLLRTKKQLEELGKKVVLEDLKVISLRTDDTKQQMDGAGENPATETAMNLKSSIGSALETCVKIWKKSFVKRDHVVKILENASKSAIAPSEIEAEVEELKKDRDEMEKSIDTTIKENEKKIEDLINNWQKSIKMKSINNEMTIKMNDLEEIVKQQQKTIQEAEDNVHSLTRKLDEKKAIYEKTINEMQEKYNKLEEELKKEKKNANENLMKSRNMRSKVNDLENRTKEAEDKNAETSNKLRQLQDQMRRKEIQWMKEKEDLKKNEALLQQKFSEKQSQFDARFNDMELIKRTAELQHQNNIRNFEAQLAIKDQEFVVLEKENNAVAERNQDLQDQIDELKNLLELKDREIDELTMKMDSVPAIEYKPSENHWMELMEYKDKISDLEHSVEVANNQVSKLESSLRSHAKLAAALKLEKDNATKYSLRLKDVLQEAREEIDFKNKTIYKIHEKLLRKDKSCTKLKQRLKELETNSEFSTDKWNMNKCQICMSTLSAEKSENSSCRETKVGKSNVRAPQYVSESLIGMSVRKVDHLRARLDHLKNMKFPINPRTRRLSMRCTWSHQSCAAKSINNEINKQIELRGKLYEILQKHADQSCEDFINLLKLTTPNGRKEIRRSLDELKPSNTKEIDERIRQNIPRKFSSKLRITESFNTISHFRGPLPFAALYDRISESPNSDNDDFGYY